MDPVPATVSEDPKATALSNSWAAWEKYYKEASRRRREMGGYRQLRELKRRRMLRERFGVAIGAALVSVMTLIFYVVLTHQR